MKKKNEPTKEEMSELLADLRNDPDMMNIFQDCRDYPERIPFYEGIIKMMGGFKKNQVDLKTLLDQLFVDQSTQADATQGATQQADKEVVP